MANITPARKLFDLLVSRDFDPEMLDSSGKPANDPSKTEIFSFDFRAESGKDYGTVVIMLGDSNELEVYCSDNVGRGMEGSDKNDWFSFLEQLKNFATRNFMSFGIKNLNRLRYSMQGQAAINEGLFESWQGKKDVSWNAGSNESRLMIKHKRSLGEGEARFRYVESLFIETVEGERYKLPFKNLTAGKAMLEHVRMGGRPYDTRGQHIAEMVNELTVLSRFRRANSGRLVEGDTASLVEQTNAYYENLQHNLKSLTTRRGYETYFESWSPSEITEESVVIEGLKHLFVTQSIDQRIEDALPLIARIQQQENAMKEANIFEAWVEQLAEGTWQTPDSPEKQMQLIELMSQELLVGADATNATEQLYDLLGDDQLFDQLEALAERDANADARQVVLNRMQELSDNPDVRKVIEQLNIDADVEMNPPDATNPADLEPMNENVTLDEDGRTLTHITNTFKRDIKDFMSGGDMSEALYDALYDYYQDDMPYGTKKARDGDPHEWVADRFAADMGVDGAGYNSPRDPEEDYSLERESVMHGDYAEEKGRMRELAGLPPEETDEGVIGTAAGGLAGLVLGGPLGAIAGAGLGQAVTSGGSSLIEKDEETDEGWKGAAVGGALGKIGGEMVGARLGPVGAVIGGALGGTAGTMIGDKLGGPDEEEKLNEVVGPVLAAGAKALVPLLSKIGPALGRLASRGGQAAGQAAKQATPAVGQAAKQGAQAVGQVAKQGAEIVAKNAVPIGVGVGAYQAITDTAKSLVGGVGEVYSDMGSAIDAITKMVGTSLDSFSIKSLAEAAVKYAIPIGILIAVLYGGKKIIDSIFSESQEGDVSLFDDAKCNMTEANQSCPVHGVEECWGSDTSPLSGQYGHSGKMKAVDKDLSFLDRLKELSGMKK